MNQIISLLNENGSFSDKYGESLFYTALAFEVLLFRNDIYYKEIEKIKDYLLRCQYDDGSWDNSHALQVPNAHDSLPKNTQFPISSNGTNVRAKEFNRLFTTTSVLKALASYEKTVFNSKIITKDIIS